MRRERMNRRIAEQVMATHMAHLEAQADAATDIFLEAFKEFKDTRKAMLAALMALDIAKTYTEEAVWFHAMAKAEAVLDHDRMVKILSSLFGDDAGFIVVELGSMPQPMRPSQANPEAN